MLIISDTNILSSLAAGGVSELLFDLFPGQLIHIPPAVEQELQAGLAQQKTYLESVWQAITTNKLMVLALSPLEQQLAQHLPGRLNAGECEAIALAQNRHARLLSNDRRAIRYCQEAQVKVVDLADLLRLFWTRGLISAAKVDHLLNQMHEVENLVLSQADRAKIFAPLPRRRQS